MVILWGNTWMLARSWRAWSRSLDTSSPRRQKLHKWSKWRNLRQRKSSRRRPRRSLFLSGNNWGEVINLLKGLKIWNLTDNTTILHFPAYKLCWHASLQHYEGAAQLNLMLDIGSSQQARPQTIMFSRFPLRRWMCARIQDTKKEIKKESAGLSPAETKDSCRCLRFLLHRWPYVCICVFIYIYICKYIFIFVLVFVSYNSVRQHPMIFFVCLIRKYAHTGIWYTVYMSVCLLWGARNHQTSHCGAQSHLEGEIFGGANIWQTLVVGLIRGWGKERVESLEKYLAYNVERWKELPPGSVKHIFFQLVFASFFETNLSVTCCFREFYFFGVFHLKRNKAWAVGSRTRMRRWWRWLHEWMSWRKSRTQFTVDASRRASVHHLSWW